MKNWPVWDAVIIGGGPAGLSAGIYLARAGWRAVLLEAEALGGRARRIERIENYPGFPSGVGGKALMRRFVAQARRWGLQTVRTKATRILHRAGLFRVLTGRSAYRGRCVLACAGASFRSLGFPGEKELMGRGVYHGAFDDAPCFAGRRVAVVGGGDAAVHQSLLLSRHAERVYLIFRGDRLKAIPLLQGRLERRRNVELIPRAALRSVRQRRGGERGLSEVEVEVEGRIRRLSAGSLFVLIGQEPGPSLGSWSSAPAGFFLAGDGRPGSSRQVAVAAGDGIRTAMECEKRLACLCGS